MYRCLLLLATALFFTGATISAFSQSGPHIVVDADRGTILSENQADRRWYPASLTKLMTAYVTFEAIRAGRISQGSPVIISTAATRQPPSKMGYKKGVSLRVDTALKIIIIKSANDVSLALAEAVSGSLSNFVSEMNQTAKRLGMSNTNFANANGLHNARQYSSARDMAVLATRIIRDYPQYANWFEAVGIRTPTRTHFTYNLLLERFPGATGMKTGFVCASGYNMAASARVNGRNLIAIVLGRTSQTDRAVSAAKLLRENTNAAGRSDLFARRQPGKPPRNMRPVLCTQKARAARYDPPAGQAVIKSQYLSARRKSNLILPIRTGGVDGPPSSAFANRTLGFSGKIPVPTKRPSTTGLIATSLLAAIGERSTGKIAIPTRRPN